MSEKIGQLTFKSDDGKKYLTDFAEAETLMRVTHLIPFPIAEPFKRWLTKVEYERLGIIKYLG